MTLSEGWREIAEAAAMKAEIVRLRAENERLREGLIWLKNRIDIRLNNYLCEMQPGYDDSIVGFNEAWDIVRVLINEQIAAAALSAHPPEPREEGGTIT